MSLLKGCDFKLNKYKKWFIYGCIALIILCLWISMFTVNKETELNMAKTFLSVPLPTEAKCTFFKSGSRHSKSAISAEFTCPKKELGQIQEALLKIGWVEDRKIIKNNEKYYFFSNGNYEYVLIDHDNASVWEESFYEK